MNQLGEKSQRVFLSCPHSLLSACPINYLAPRADLGNVLQHFCKYACLRAWGPVFRRLEGGSDSFVELRLCNVNRYVEGLQVK